MQSIHYDLLISLYKYLDQLKTTATAKKFEKESKPEEVMSMRKSGTDFRKTGTDFRKTGMSQQSIVVTDS